MNLIDLRCNSCENIWEYDKKTTSAPSPIGVPCPECKSTDTERNVASNRPATDVAVGNFGTGANGYENSMTHHPSTKYGRYKGKRI